MLKKLIILTLLLTCTGIVALPARAEEDRYGFRETFRDAKGNSRIAKRDDGFTPRFGNDRYKGSGILCGIDCQRQDRIREDRPSAPYQLNNSFNNGSRGKSMGGIVSDQLSTTGGR